MRRLSSMFARAVAVLAACLAVPAASGEQPKAPAAMEVVRPALWQVSDEDTTIYLFGTIHALPAGIGWFDGKVAEAFDGSQQLVTEIVSGDPAEIQGLVIRRAMLPGGQNLRAMLAAPEREQYENALTTLGLPLQTFDAFDPWYAAVGLSTVPLMRDGYARANGVDETLEARARELGREHAALETPEFQLDLFDSLPMDAQKRYLVEVVEQLPNLREQLAAMVEAWKRGDADELARLMNATEDDPALLEALLISRNRTWAGWVDRRLDSPGTVFLAVGAGHLAGQGSLQDQLTARGIVWRRVQ